MFLCTIVYILGYTMNYLIPLPASSVSSSSSISVPLTQPLSSGGRANFALFSFPLPSLPRSWLACSMGEGSTCKMAIQSKQAQNAANNSNYCTVWTIQFIKVYFPPVMHLKYIVPQENGLID